MVLIVVLAFIAGVIVGRTITLSPFHTPADTGLNIGSDKEIERMKDLLRLEGVPKRRLQFFGHMAAIKMKEENCSRQEAIKWIINWGSKKNNA